MKARAFIYAIASKTQSHEFLCRNFSKSNPKNNFQWQEGCKFSWSIFQMLLWWGKTLNEGDECLGRDSPPPICEGNMICEDPNKKGVNVGSCHPGVCVCAVVRNLITPQVLSVVYRLWFLKVLRLKFLVLSENVIQKSSRRGVVQRLNHLEFMKL